MNRNAEQLNEARQAFLRSCGRDYTFPAGGAVPLLTTQEQKLLVELGNGDLGAAEQSRALAADCEWPECYTIAIFAVRLAIFGVRNRVDEPFRVGVAALAAVCSKLDWRDELRALAIFEHCGKLASVDFSVEMLRLKRALYGDGQAARFDAYFTRTDEMRSIDTMGIICVGEGSQLTFRSI
jgi:hypothetical protein